MTNWRLTDLARSNLLFPSPDDRPVAIIPGASAGWRVTVEEMTQLHKVAYWTAPSAYTGNQVRTHFF